MIVDQTSSMSLKTSPVPNQSNLQAPYCFTAFTGDEREVVRSYAIRPFSWYFCQIWLHCKLFLQRRMLVIYMLQPSNLAVIVMHESKLFPVVDCGWNPSMCALPGLARRQSIFTWISSVFLCQSRALCISHMVQYGHLRNFRLLGHGWRGTNFSTGSPQRLA